MRYYLYRLIRQAAPHNSPRWALSMLRWCMSRRNAIPSYLPAVDAALSDRRSQGGYGEGYCYIWTRTHLHVCAESLEIVRMMVTDRPLKRSRTYKANPKRTHFIFSK